MLWVLVEDKEIMEEEHNDGGLSYIHVHTCMYAEDIYAMISKFHNYLISYLFSAFLWKRKLRLIEFK